MYAENMRKHNVHEPSTTQKRMIKIRGPKGVSLKDMDFQCLDSDLRTAIQAHIANECKGRKFEKQSINVYESEDEELNDGLKQSNELSDWDDSDLAGVIVYIDTDSSNDEADSTKDSFQSWRNNNGNRNVPGRKIEDASFSLRAKAEPSATGKRFAVPSLVRIRTNPFSSFKYAVSGSKKAKKQQPADKKY